MKFTVLNTRAAHQAVELTHLIENKLGAQCIELPLLNIEMIDAEHWQFHCPVAVPALLIFTSANAVHHSMDVLKDHWQVMPLIAAIGPATKRALEHCDVTVDITPEYSNSDSLITHKALQSLSEKTVVLVKGKGGRQVLQTFLNQKKSNLIELNVYQRTCPSQLSNQIKKIWQKASIDLILIHSVNALTNLLDQANKATLNKIKDTACLTLSHRIKKAALAYGIKHVFIAENNTLESSIKHYMTHRKPS